MGARSQAAASWPPGPMDALVAAWNLILLPDEMKTSSRAVRYPAARALRDREGTGAMRGCLHASCPFHHLKCS